MQINNKSEKEIIVYTTVGIVGSFATYFSGRDFVDDKNDCERQIMERVIGYREVEINKIVSRPVKYTGKEDNGFHDLPPVTAKIKVMQPIYEQLGRHTFTTVDAPELPKYIDIPWVNPRVSHEE